MAKSILHQIAEEDHNKRNYDCVDCGMNTDKGGEYYSVHCNVWNAGGGKRNLLCIGCLEKRIGRKLEANDFRDCRVNTDTTGKHANRSDRLRNRLNRRPEQELLHIEVKLLREALIRIGNEDSATSLIHRIRDKAKLQYQEQDRD